MNDNKKVIFGNLSEWCNDWYKENIRPSFLRRTFTYLVNPLGPTRGDKHVCRNKGHYRSGYDLHHKDKNLGFRLAYDSI